MADIPHDPAGPQPDGNPDPIRPVPGGPPEPVTPILPDPTHEQPARPGAPEPEPEPA